MKKLKSPVVIEKGYLRHVNPDEKSLADVVPSLFSGCADGKNHNKSTNRVRLFRVMISEFCAGLLQQEVIDVLIRFRRNPVALSL